ncbi:hypothetical protein LP420_32065 [Massilia sp. B-10]|nr:hypothetical protein LP420_32065 [Massilia sp. B-10]
MNVTSTTVIPSPGMSYNGTPRYYQWKWDYITTDGKPSSAGPVGTIQLSLNCDEGDSVRIDGVGGGDARVTCTRYLKQTPPCDCDQGGMGAKLKAAGPPPENR